MFKLKDNGNLSALDRYVPRRAGTNFERSRYLLLEVTESPITSNVNDIKDLICKNKTLEEWNKQTYQTSLQKTLLNPQSQRLLNFFENQSLNKRSPLETISTGGYNLKVWPSYPRRKPCLNQPIDELHLPRIEECFGCNVVDWGSNGNFMSVYEGDLWCWSSEANNSAAIIKVGGRAGNYVKWNHSATAVAFTLRDQGICIWRNNMIITEARCMCLRDCVTICMQWSKCNWLITGCTGGRLSMWNKRFKLLKTVPEAHAGTILNIAISCNENYLATSGLDEFVKIWKWPTFDLYFGIKFQKYVKAMAWHPWRDPLLATGGTLNKTFLSIWKVTNSSCVGQLRISEELSYIDSLAWNKTSGELVMSYHIEDSEDSNQGYLTVLSDLNSKVELINWQHGIIPYLLWNCDGTKLATASTDKTLRIWEFLEKSQKEKLCKKKKRISAFDLTIR